jgi:hypothetical protein
MKIPQSDSTVVARIFLFRIASIPFPDRSDPLILARIDYDCPDLLRPPEVFFPGWSLRHDKFQDTGIKNLESNGKFGRKSQAAKKGTKEIWTVIGKSVVADVSFLCCLC